MVESILNSTGCIRQKAAHDGAEVMATLIKKQQGRVMDSLGNNLLVEFADAIDVGRSSAYGPKKDGKKKENKLRSTRTTPSNGFRCC